MNEPAVTLTDYGLTAETAILAWLLWRRGGTGPVPRGRWIAFFIAVGIASFAGGTVHGFFAGGGAAARALWLLTLAALGAAALAAWMIAARLLERPAAERALTLAGLAVGAVYAAALGLGVRTFRAAILAYLPATACLLVALCVAWARHRAADLLVGAAGLGLTFAGSAVQQAGLALHPVWFDHNALYHLIQAVALYLLFRGARAFAAPPCVAGTGHAHPA